MLPLLLGVLITFCAIFSAIYLFYFTLVIKTSKKDEYFEKLKQIIESEIDFENLPQVTIIIPVYNEEEIIYSKIKNISELNYPKHKIEVFVVDDHSTDKTREESERALKDFGLNGKVIQNETRKGVNASYNYSIPKASGEYILTTDADAVIPPDTLLKAVKVLLNLDNVGAVAAKMVPSYNTSTISTKTANSYTSLYNTMLIAESAISSTFPGSTSCMLMRKSAFSPIATSYGSSDGNISLSVIKKGFRFLLAPCIEYYEPLPQKFSDQIRQKIRRAARLIQSAFLNLDILFAGRYGKFGKVIFPLRFLMMVLCPLLFSSSFFLFIVIIFFTSPLLLVIFVICLASIFVLSVASNARILSLITSFFMHQCYLCVGLLQRYRKFHVWQSVNRKNKS
jgi:cellulose synthase/poly-beta-1,6-N-acetylglucosamine synthase-like glycosyltransferase